MLNIDDKLCTGCGICAEVCPNGSISVSGGKPVVNEDCSYCGACFSECPVGALSLPIAENSTGIHDDYRGFLVVAEKDEADNLKRVTFELLSKARALADRNNEPVAVLIIGEAVSAEDMRLLGSVGCDKTLYAEHIVGYDTDQYAAAVTAAIGQTKPAAVLFPATENGRDMAPRVACRIKTGLTADCTELDLDENDNLIQVRPTYGGNIIASIITPNHRPQMASVRPGVMPVVKAQSGALPKVETVRVDEPACPSLVQLCSRIKKELMFKDAASAHIVVAGGYGLGGEENFKLLYKVAEKLNAGVGATRKAVDEGWAPMSIQVGQTGKTIAPDVYIAFGISGVLQHAIGIKNAKKVIAVNNDPAAPIFGFSDVAILGDAASVLTTLHDII